MRVYHNNVFVFVILCCVSIVSSYNVDTQNVIRHQGPRDSMFGFTVAAHFERGNSMVLVGAPKAQTNQPGVTNGGAVYRCHTSRNNSCYQIPFDQTGDYLFNERIIDQKSHQWFGSTLYSAGPDGPVVACASRYIWFSTKYERRDPVGTCYIARNNFRDFAEYSPCRTSQWGYHRQGSCQAGFSAAISKDGDNLFLGAPGNCYWQGRMYSINGQANFPYRPPLFAPYGAGKVVGQSLSRRPNVIHTLEGSAADDDSYLGYSIAVGNFTGENQQGIAAGMPRGGSLLGKVLLYTWNLTNFLNITGRQMGSYFGYAVAAADIDGDQYDDLIIGAPLYTEPNNEGKYEVGKVYVVYQRSDKGNFRKLDELDGINSKSRFGLSVASLGDINLDDYMDIAVGAPYDGPDERGAVYIFHGSRYGIRQKYIQVIYAEQVSMPPPSTFGFSIAGGIDLDRNEYPDTVIGAYLSDTTFFLRSRPVVKVYGHAQFQTYKKEIDIAKQNCHILNKDNVRVPVACTTIETCLNYTGVGVPPVISLQLQYSLDTQKKKDPRMFFLDSPQYNVMNDNWQLLRGTTSKCNNMTVYIKNDIRDKLTPLDIEVTYSMDTRNYRELAPVLDLTNTSLKKDSISVSKNCSDNNVCIPDLILEVSSNVKRYLLATKEDLVFDVTVSNNGEDSFETTFSVQMPEDVNYIRTQGSGDVKVSCVAPTKNHTIICDIGNPLPAKKIVKFSMFFKPFYKEGMNRYYVFDMEVESANPEKEETMKNNKVSIKLPIWVNSRLVLKGISRPSEVRYNYSYYAEKEKVKHEREIGPQVIHVYTITNDASNINAAEVLIFWPYATVSGEDLMYLLEPPHVYGNITCEGADYNYLGYQVERRKKSIWETLEIDFTKEEGAISSSEISSSQTGVLIEIDKVKSGTSTDILGGRENINIKSEEKYENATGDASLIYSEREQQRGHQTQEIGVDGKGILVTTGQEGGSSVKQTQTITKTFRNTTSGPGGKVYTYTQNTTIVRGPGGEIIRNETKTHGSRQNGFRRSNGNSVTDQEFGSQGSGKSQEKVLVNEESYPYSSVEYEIPLPNVQNQNTLNSTYISSSHQGGHHSEQYHGGQHHGNQYSTGQYHGSQSGAQSGGRDGASYSSTYNRTFETSYSPAISAGTLSHGAKVGVLDVGLPDRNIDQSLSEHGTNSQLNKYDSRQGKYDPDLDRIEYNTPVQRGVYKSRIYSDKRTGQHDSGENRNYHESKGNEQESYSESHWSKSGTNKYNLNIGNDEEEPENSNYKRKKRQTARDIDLTKEVQCKATKCKFVKCFVGPLRENGEVTIALRTRINVNTLKNISISNNITFSTMMVAKITSVPYIGIPSEEEKAEKIEVATKVVAPQPDTTPDVVPLWVVILSAVAGAIILLLLIFLFYKCGFFKRNRPSNVPERQPLNRNGHYSSGDEAL